MHTMLTQRPCEERGDPPFNYTSGCGRVISGPQPEKDSVLVGRRLLVPAPKPRKDSLIPKPEAWGGALKEQPKAFSTFWINLISQLPNSYTEKTISKDKFQTLKVHRIGSASTCLRHRPDPRVFFHASSCKTFFFRSLRGCKLSILGIIY